MKKIIALSAIMWTAGVMAQGTSDADPFDLSPSTAKVDELGVVTQTEVDGLEQRSKELFNAGNCKAAIPVLEEYAKKANWLANMVSATLDPYYGASRRDREDFSYTKLQKLIPLETLANNYKGKRNIAFAMQGECLMEMGENERAIPMLLKALDLIALEDTAWWDRTRENLLTILDVKV